MGGGKAIGIWLIESNLKSTYLKPIGNSLYNIFIIRPIIIIRNTYIYVGAILLEKEWQLAK